LGVRSQEIGFRIDKENFFKNAKIRVAQIRLSFYFQLLASGFWLLASGFWLLASGFWLLASGFF
jgi:hypothetical protein